MSKCESQNENWKAKSQRNRNNSGTLGRKNSWIWGGERMLKKKVWSTGLEKFDVVEAQPQAMNTNNPNSRKDNNHTIKEQTPSRKPRWVNKEIEKVCGIIRTHKPEAMNSANVGRINFFQVSTSSSFCEGCSTNKFGCSDYKKFHSVCLRDNNYNFTTYFHTSHREPRTSLVQSRSIEKTIIFKEICLVCLVYLAFDEGSGWPDL